MMPQPLLHLEGCHTTHGRHLHQLRARRLAQARSLADAIEAQGWSVLWDRRIPPGTAFEDFIEERIAESAAVVVLWSPHSVTSRWVGIEAAHGRDRNPSALIPVLISPSNIPFAFRDLHAADLSAWQPGDRGVEFQELLASIDRLVPRRAVSPETGGANAFTAPDAPQIGMIGRAHPGTSRPRAWVSSARIRAGALAIVSVVAAVRELRQQYHSASRIAAAGCQPLRHHGHEWQRPRMDTKLVSAVPVCGFRRSRRSAALGSRVVRGGSHGDLGERTVRASFRADEEADSRSDAVGFRVVLARLLP